MTDPESLLPTGTQVEIVDSSRPGAAPRRLPLGRQYVGLKGVTERAEKDGCYVRFADHSYVFVFWNEIKALS